MGRDGLRNQTAAVSAPIYNSINFKSRPPSPDRKEHTMLAFFLMLALHTSSLQVRFPELVWAGAVMWAIAGIFDLITATIKDWRRHTKT